LTVAGRPITIHAPGRNKKGRRHHAHEGFQEKTVDDKSVIIAFPAGVAKPEDKTGSAAPPFLEIR
jgi:hypothetical protein